MTREQMLDKIEVWRKDGHKIDIVGPPWKCRFDEFTGEGATPMEAFEAAEQKHQQ